MKKAVFLIPVFIVVLDQVSKYFADNLIGRFEPVPVLPFLNLVNVHNTGSAFGLFKSFGNVFFIAVSAAAIVFITVMLIKEKEHRAALSLLIGGALGNLIDRIFLGYVRDFVDVYAGDFHWPAFNVADSSLTIGIFLILFKSFFGRRKGG